MIKRIIFLVESTFNKRDYERFGINLLRKNGFGVEVWDCTPVFQEEYYKNYTPPDPFKFESLKIFNNEKVLYYKIKSLTKSDLVLMFGFRGLKYLKLHRILSSSKADYVIPMINAIPTHDEWKDLSLEKILRKILKNIFFMLFKIGFVRIKSARFAIIASKKAIFQNYFIGKSTELIWTHTLDYDLYLKERNKKTKEKNIAVFLDEYQPFHPDWILLGVAGKLNPDRYFNLLNTFFDIVEKKTGLKVVIAAHPRSKYEEHKGCWGKRKWYRGKTIQLVKQAKLVIAHSSISIGFANLFRKPIIFINDAELNKMPVSCYLIKAMSEAHGKKQIFIDSGEVAKIDWKKEMKIDKKAYDNYKEDYIKNKGSPNLPFWQIVADRLKQ